MKKRLETNVTEPVDLEKDMWRKIFLNLSKTSSRRFPNVEEDGSTTPIVAESTPEIDIKRLVDFLHTREYSSRKVEQPRNRFNLIRSVSVSHKIFLDVCIRACLIKLTYTFSARGANRSPSSSISIYGLFIKVKRR